MTHQQPFAEIVGRNARRVRLADKSATLEQVATVARRYGLKWSTARVVELERGQLAISGTLLFLLTQVLGDVKGHRIRISELFEGAGSVELNSATDVPTELLRNAVDGDVVDWGAFRAQSTDAAPAGITHTGAGLAEERAARRLGISPADVNVHANALWGTTLTEHRDALAGQNANGQTRGRITRQLVDQVRGRVNTGSTSSP
jgi:hypothetical protein